MSFYSKITNFRRKDSLPPLTPDKLITGIELEREYQAVKLAVDSMIEGAYVRTTNFQVKDGLTSGNPNKKVLGVDLDEEFSNIEDSMRSIGGEYAKITDFTELDVPHETISGDQIQDEFDAIQLAIKQAWDDGIQRSIDDGNGGTTGPGGGPNSPGPGYDGEGFPIWGNVPPPPSNFLAGAVDNIIGYNVDGVTAIGDWVGVSENLRGLFWTSDGNKLRLSGISTLEDDFFDNLFITNNGGLVTKYEKNDSVVSISGSPSRKYWDWGPFTSPFFVDTLYVVELD